MSHVHRVRLIRALCSISQLNQKEEIVITTGRKNIQHIYEKTTQLCRKLSLGLRGVNIVEQFIIICTVYSRCTVGVVSGTRNDLFINYKMLIESISSV